MNDDDSHCASALEDAGHSVQRSTESADKPRRSPDGTDETERECPTSAPGVAKVVERFAKHPRKTAATDGVKHSTERVERVCAARDEADNSDEGEYRREHREQPVIRQRCRFVDEFIAANLVEGAAEEVAHLSPPSGGMFGEMARFAGRFGRHPVTLRNGNAVFPGLDNERHSGSIGEMPIAWSVD